MRKVIFITLLSFSFSNIIYIPDEYPTIQEGIDASTTGDSVIVSDGEYFENLYLNKEITLGSYYVLNGDTTHRDNTIINGNNASDDAEYGSCLLITGDDIYPKIQGFTITGGKGTVTNEELDGETIYKRRGGGVTVYQSNATVTYNRFYNNGYIETEDINGGGAASFIGTGVGVGRETPRDINRDWVVDFSHNIYDDNSADHGSTFLSWHYHGEIDMSNCYYDVYNCEEDEVTLYWVYTDSTTFDFEEGDGELCLNPDLANVYVSPQGDDYSNDGTQDFPFRTIDKAFSIIAPDSTNIVSVNLDEGTYAPSTTGEDFPIIMISNVNLIGEGEEVTILDAEADSINQDRVIYILDITIVTISDLTITGGYLEGYVGNKSGGGIYIKYSNNISLQNLIIINNKANVGGGIYSRLSHIINIANVTINENTTCIEGVGYICSGGGMYLSSSYTTTLYNVLILENTSGSYGGGGIYIGGTNPILSDVDIIGNTTTQWGGGVRIVSSNPYFNDVNIINNTADIGGGIHLYNSFGQFIDVNINDNIGFSAGGGILIEAATYSSFNNIIISNNTAQRGGGMVVLDVSSPLIINMTMESNNAEQFGGGIYTYWCPAGNEPPEIINSIIWNNYPESIYLDGYECSNNIKYSNIEGDTLLAGEANINQNPSFTDPVNGDYTLQEGSPCIDAGIADLDGDGEEDITDYYGSAPDMGAFEWIPEMDIEKLPIPTEYILHPAYPNPFNPITTITYSIPEPTDITIRVYNLLGKQVVELINDYIPSGNHQVRWNADNYPSGQYFVKLTSQDYTQTQKIMLLK